MKAHALHLDSAWIGWTDLKVVKHVPRPHRDDLPSRYLVVPAGGHAARLAAGVTEPCRGCEDSRGGTLGGGPFDTESGTAGPVAASADKPGTR
jgi:hypothetical protein